jgi:hypothetical protein
VLFMGMIPVKMDDFEPNTSMVMINKFVFQTRLSFDASLFLLG